MITGADVRKNDGIYSAYFTDFTEEGNYQLDMSAVGDNTASKQRQPWMSSGVQPADWGQSYTINYYPIQTYYFLLPVKKSQDCHETSQLTPNHIDKP